MTLRYPFQKICLVPSGSQDQQILLGASGCTISCISLSDGQILYQWPSQVDETDDDNEENDDDRPVKKRRLDANGHDTLSRQPSEASDASLEIVAERKKGERKKSKIIIDTKLPNVSHLLATSDGKHIIAVTAEDKAIRVFRVSASGKLIQLSQRSLPKKLCAIRLTKDEKTILAADKFGDVYAVPLHQSEGWKQKEKAQNDEPFKPSASESTVHTKGNLEALRQQMDRKQQSGKREGPDFEHQVLLGHVSLLTDLIVAESVIHGKTRPFILTSDRDEHIRVSRGMPQAHIIENFCLGHNEFVTKLCIPPTAPNLLIAGNGEVSLRLYDWLHGKLLQKMPLKYHALADYDADPELVPVQEISLPENRTEDKLAVSGIWPVGFSKTTNPKGIDETLILVALEGLPLLICFILYPDHLHHYNPIHFRGNVLDVVVCESARQVVVSVDNVHEPGCLKTYRDARESQVAPFQLLKLDTNEKRIEPRDKYKWEVTDLPFDATKLMEVSPEAPQSTPDDKDKNKTYERTFSPLGEFLYGLENLRKKRGVTAEDEAEMEGEDEVMRASKTENVKAVDPTEPL